MSPQSVRELPLGAADHLAHLALREAALLASKFDFHGHRAGHEPATELPKPRYRPLELGQEGYLP